MKFEASFNFSVCPKYCALWTVLFAVKNIAGCFEVIANFPMANI
jgi:hypothetical protein